jgi:endogenous inhibitor of DNA gyrase (YacG/DUF329 family)
MPTTTTLKAPERPCRECGATLPAELSGPGRPKAFCNRRCRRTWHSRQELAAEHRERAEEQDRLTQEYETRIYGPRSAKRWAKERAARREARYPAVTLKSERSHR